MELAVVLTWVVAEGGAPVIAYLLMEKVKWLCKLAPEAKRCVAMGLAAGVAVLAFVGQVAMEYRPVPESARGWIEGLFYVGLAAIPAIMTQIIHGRLVLSKK